MSNQLMVKETKMNIGDLIKVHYGNGNPFDGILISISGSTDNRTFTVRKMGVGGIGVERIFPLSSPLLIKVEIKKQGKVRRAKLYYLREQTKKQLKKLTRTNPTPPAKSGSK